MDQWIDEWMSSWVGLVGIDPVVIDLLIVTDVVLERDYSHEM